MCSLNFHPPTKKRKKKEAANVGAGGQTQACITASPSFTILGTLGIVKQFESLLMPNAG
jgi:hypothetical protein